MNPFEAARSSWHASFTRRWPPAGGHGAHPGVDGLTAAGSLEWAIRVLFSRSPDNRLFDVRQVLPTSECSYPGMSP